MDKIEELLTRGVANIIPSKEDLKRVLESGKKLNIYFGIDPTNTKIHLGHAVPLRKLQKLAELGHNITLLIGDFTALVGDTSDKESERPILTEEEIKENFRTYRKQSEKIVDFSKVKIRHNSEWLKNLTYAQLIRLKQQFSLNDFISRELIRKRLDNGKTVRLDETEYPIMQGYDSYIMDTDLQIGATDQTFNMQAGRTLQKKLREKESYVLATEFLMGTDGRKMSKTWENAIWLEDEPNEIFGKVMSIKDDLIIQYFTLATNMPMEQIRQTEEKLRSGENPINIKKELAYEIVKELNNEDESRKAKEYFETAYQKGEAPDEIKVFNLDTSSIPNPTIIDALIISGTVSSRSDAKRLVMQGAVEIDNKKTTDPTLQLEKGQHIFRAGRKFAKIEVR